MAAPASTLSFHSPSPRPDSQLPFFTSPRPTLPYCSSSSQQASYLGPCATAYHPASLLLLPPPPQGKESAPAPAIHAHLIHPHHHQTKSTRMFADACFGFGFSAAYSPSPPPGYSPAFTHHEFPTYSYSAAAADPAPQLPLLPAAADDAIFAHLGGMGQPSLISEYDLGGEGDLFKAPEPIIEEEPLLSLDPVAAAISMMSGGDNAMDDTIKASSMGLSEVLYKCEKELMEKTAIEETISELLDVKIPMLQVEDAPSGEFVASPLAGDECSLQKSVSSGCLNSSDWMNGPSSVRPNFLDFQGLDFEAAFGLRRAYSEGDIQNLGANTPRPGNSGNVITPCERLVTISDLKTEERKQKLSRYRKKKIKRNFGRKIKYACRKALADSQPRVRGRFAKMDDGDMLKLRK